MDVTERLLNNAEEGKLYGLRKASNLIQNVEVYLDLGARRKAFDHPSSRRDQTRFVEQWRMQKLGEGANLLKALIDPLRGFRYRFLVRLEVA